MGTSRVAVNLPKLQANDISRHMPIFQAVSKTLIQYRHKRESRRKKGEKIYNKVI